MCLSTNASTNLDVIGQDLLTCLMTRITRIWEKHIKKTYRSNTLKQREMTNQNKLKSGKFHAIYTVWQPILHVTQGKTMEDIK